MAAAPTYCFQQADKCREEAARAIDDDIRAYWKEAGNDAGLPLRNMAGLALGRSSAKRQRSPIEDEMGRAQEAIIGTQRRAPWA